MITTLVTFVKDLGEVPFAPLDLVVICSPAGVVDRNALPSFPEVQLAVVEPILAPHDLDVNVYVVVVCPHTFPLPTVSRHRQIRLARENRVIPESIPSRFRVIPEPFPRDKLLFDK